MSFDGFLLLEEVESSFGTSIQKIEKIIKRTLDEPYLSALSSRIVRQETPAAHIECHNVTFSEGLQSAQAFSILMQGNRVVWTELFVSEAIGAEGWRMVADAKHPRGTKLIVVSRDGLAEGNREDFRGMLDAGYDFKIFKALGDLQANNRWGAYVSHSVDGWGRLERVLDMSEEEFSAEIR